MFRINDPLGPHSLYYASVLTLYCLRLKSCPIKCSDQGKVTTGEDLGGRSTSEPKIRVRGLSDYMMRLVQVGEEKTVAYCRRPAL
jgi:hypothetical protein